MGREKQSKRKDETKAAKAPRKSVPARKAVAVEAKLKKKHRFRPGTKALLDIKKQQKQTNHGVPKACFVRLVRELFQDASTTGEGKKLEESAKNALQEAAEKELIDIFSLAQDLCIHAGRKMVTAEDFKFATGLQNARANAVRQSMGNQ